MAPDYLYDKNDKKTLMAYRNLIDCLEPERPIEYSYQPMDLLTTNKYYIKFLYFYHCTYKKIK